MSMDLDLFFDSGEDTNTTVSKLEDTLFINLIKTGEKVEKNESLLGYCRSHTLKLRLYLNDYGYGTERVLDNGIHLSKFSYYLSINRAYGGRIPGDVYAAYTCEYWAEVLHKVLGWNVVGLENFEHALYSHYTELESKGSD